MDLGVNVGESQEGQHQRVVVGFSASATRPLGSARARAEPAHRHIATDILRSGALEEPCRIWVEPPFSPLVPAFASSSAAGSL